MRRLVLIFGLLLFVVDFGRLAGQTLLDPAQWNIQKKPPSLPGGIKIGPTPPKTGLAENETGKETFGGGMTNPYLLGPSSFIPNFGGTVIPRGMTREDFVRWKAQEAQQQNQKREQQEQMLLFQERVQDQIESALRSLNVDLFGETDDIPSNLRKELPVDKKSQSAENMKTAPQTPVPLPADAPLKTDDDAFATEMQKKREELKHMENAEDRHHMEEILQQREQARKKFVERRLEAEQGADFFEIPPELRLSEQHLKAGWCNLFDGKTFFGWRTQKEGPYGGGRFTIENRMICSDPEHPGLLYTTNQFGDATFQIEYQAEENSEVFLLVRTSPNPSSLHSSCYAVVLNSVDFQRPRGTILGRQMLSVEQLQKQERDTKTAVAADNIPPDKRWRKLTAQFDGSMFRVMIGKDEPVTVYESRPPGCGHLGLLVTKGHAKFRNLTWFPGSSVSLFDGIDPTPEWRFRKGDVQWTAMRDVALQLTGGPGVVETTKTFDNFVLQLEYKITFTSGRSGLFFRSTAREDQTGYEISIQNFPMKEDRVKTVGVDTGAFRGIKQGRYLKPNEQGWNYLTLVAVDRQFQTWVNGVPVCEWSVPADQPLIVSGTVQLLAPTKETNVQFRNIRVTPIQPRSEKPRTFDDRMKTTYTGLSEQRKAAEREKRLDDVMRQERKNIP